MPEDEATDLPDVLASDPATAPSDEATSPGDATTPGDPLLDRAARIADLPLDERPGAFDALNRSLVAELHALEDA